MIISCSDSTRFELVPSSRTGITFNNLVTDTDSMNIMNYEYIYNGAGTGIGDLNNDGLPDVVFAANQVSPRVYINLGDFRFRDITQNLQGLTKQWFSSVQMADVNSDGWLDIYFTSTAGKNPENCKNRLFINNGTSKEGDPAFTEMAEKYGIADSGQSTNAAFFDYDLDGFPDLYILNNTVTQRMQSNYMEKITDGSAPNNDRLYHNNRNGTFTDVTIQAGIVYEGYGLGLAVGDVNKDGYPDIYVSNDFMSNDLFYVNQRNGTFKNEISKYFSYQSRSSMGNDMADVNNDGNPDMFTLDMFPEKYNDIKRTIGGFGYIYYINDEKYGYEHQYLRNMMHMHNGFLKGELLPFSETGQIMGIYATDWSWSPLFADYDNDGDKDLIVSNGYPRDLTDKDWIRLKIQSAGFYTSDNKTLIEMIPAQKINNIAYENNGPFSFSKTKDWLPDVPSFSYGAAFADLDLDGDLDYVANNINDNAFIMRNRTVEKSAKSSRFLEIRLKGKVGNTLALGAKVELWAGAKYQYAEHFLTRGYSSSVDPLVHFGLGKLNLVDSVRVIWPSGGKISLKKNIPANSIITFDENEASATVTVDRADTQKLLFEKREGASIYHHNQNDFVDYALYQKLIPHKFSQIGPRMAKGDINNDGQEDLIVGSSNASPTTVLLRSGTSFREVSFEGFTGQKEFTEADIAIMDIDNDGDNDIISAAGGYDNQYQEEYRHYLYVNENGKFTRKSLPVPAFSASVIRPFDFDHDGRTDIFIGSRIKNNMFPFATYSWLIHNRGELTVDSASKLDLGMVTDAVWADIDNDGWEDLVVTREWNSIALIRNEGGKKLTISPVPEFEAHTGIWYSIISGDFDKDGDNDLIAGNIGENIRFRVSGKYPMNMYVLDFEKDGIVDPVTTSFWPDAEGKMKEYPVNYLDELWSQSPYLKARLRNYSTFSTMEINDLIPVKMAANASKLNINTVSSCIIMNNGKSFSFQKLPAELQLSPLKKMIAADIDNDGYTDIVAGGNDYSYEVPTGNFDACKGIVLLNRSLSGIKDGIQFDMLGPAKSGLLLQGMLESMLWFEGDTSFVVAGFNRADAQVFYKNELSVKKQ